jgi:pimeloyl-ACP methyl ester carboxylesterase
MERINPAYLENPESALRARFEKQLAHTELLTLQGRPCEVFDLNPEASEGVPVVFVPGFGATLREYAPSIFELFRKGDRIISVTPPQMSPIEHGSLTKFPSHLEERAEAILALCAHKQVQQVDILAHSEGAIHAVIAAGIHEEQFRNFVFSAPAGFTPASVVKILKRSLFHQVQQIMQEKGRGKDAQGHAKQKRAYSLASVRELLRAMDPGKIDITPELRALHEAGHGVSVLAHVDDQLVRMNNFQRNRGVLRSAKELGIDGFYALKGSHNDGKANAAMGIVFVEALRALSYASVPHEDEHTAFSTAS